MPFGRERELGVKGGHAVHLFKRQVHAVCDHDLHFKRQVAIDLLRLLHDMHEHAFVMLVFLNHGLELRFLLSGAMKGDTADFFEH